MRMNNCTAMLVIPYRAIMWIPPWIFTREKWNTCSQLSKTRKVQMSVYEWINCGRSCSEIFHNEKQWTVYTFCNLDDSQRHYALWKKLVSLFHYMIFAKRQNHNHDQIIDTIVWLFLSPANVSVEIIPSATVL